MPHEFKIEIVPLSEVPPQENAIRVDDLEAVLVDERPVFTGTSNPPEQEEVGFEVQGLPSGKKAWIKQQRDKYQLVLELRNGDSEWLGEYSSVQDALQALSDKLRPGLFL